MYVNYLAMSPILLAEILGVPAIFLGGSAFHFIYKYGGKKKWQAVISPVNESIWEHLKIAFYPALIYSVIQAFLLVSYSAAFLTAELLGIYVMFAFILVAEWIYPAMLKRNVLALDLLVFFIAISLSQILSYLWVTNNVYTLPVEIAWLAIVIQTAVFAAFSFWPPRLPLFRDSVDGKYGIK